MADTLAALGLRASGATATAAAAAAALTLTLFLGSLLQSALDDTLRWPGAGLSALQTTRVRVVAPLAEEWCFRACEPSSHNIHTHTTHQFVLFELPGMMRCRLASGPVVTGLLA
jgi:hypothetical protein